MRLAAGDNFRKRCGRRFLAWGLLWFVAVQGTVVVYLEWRHPDFLDPKYGWRVRALRALTSAQRKQGKLILALGSSRTEQGFRPSLLANSPGKNGSSFYNLGRGGSSPLLHLLTLRRLLADGIRPDHLLVEIFPPALTEEEGGVTIYKPTVRDLPLLLRYSVNARTWGFWLQDRLLLWYKCRNGFLAWAAPQTLPPSARWGDRLWNYQGGEWRVISETISPAQRRRLTKDAQRRYFSALQHFRITTDADRALRELLDICRAQQIGVTLFLMPEASEFRGWYPAETRQRLTAYLDELRRGYAVALIDARRWIGDDCFSDGHHLLAGGAAIFTARFADSISARERDNDSTSEGE